MSSKRFHTNVTSKKFFNMKGMDSTSSLISAFKTFTNKRHKQRYSIKKGFHMDSTSSFISGFQNVYIQMSHTEKILYMKGFHMISTLGLMSWFSKPFHTYVTSRKIF